jgi:hypothetical protein
VSAVPLRDAAPASIMLVGHEGRDSPFVDALLTFARTLTAGAPEIGSQGVGESA